jgi:DNA-binding CsgD family transcriptional regulator
MPNQYTTGYSAGRSLEIVDEIAKLLVETSMTVKEISKQMGLGITTINNYIATVYVLYGVQGEGRKRHLLARSYYGKGRIEWLRPSS